MRKSYRAFGAQVPSSPSSVILQLYQNYKEYIPWNERTPLHRYHGIKKFNICVAWGLENGINFFPLPLFDRRSNQRSRSYLFECFCLVYMIKMRFAWWTDGAKSLATAVPNTTSKYPSHPNCSSKKNTKLFKLCTIQHDILSDIGHYGSCLVLTEVVVDHVLSRRVYTKKYRM